MAAVNKVEGMPGCWTVGAENSNPRVTGETVPENAMMSPL